MSTFIFECIGQRVRFNPLLGVISQGFSLGDAWEICPPINYSHNNHIRVLKGGAHKGGSQGYNELRYRKAPNFRGLKICQDHGVNHINSLLFMYKFFQNHENHEIF